MAKNSFITLDPFRRRHITSNLFEALLHLRSEVKEVALWVDALCINQDNNHVRSEQVASMGSIYHRATRVLVWLGPCSSNSCQHHWLRPSESGETRESEDHLRRMAHSLSTRGSEAWWNRVWIIQELVVAKKVTVMLGRHAWAWEDFVYSFYSIDIDQADGATMDSTPHATADTQISPLDGMRREYHQSQTSNLSLRNFLYLTEGGSASDDRDRVYSILDLLRTEQKAYIIPDYSLGKEQVFAQAALALLCT